MKCPHCGKETDQKPDKKAYTEKLGKLSFASKAMADEYRRRAGR